MSLRLLLAVRHVFASLAVGLLLFVSVAVWVAAALQPFVQLSVVVGLLAGLLVGTVTATFAYRRLDGDHPDTPIGLQP